VTILEKMDDMKSVIEEKAFQQDNMGVAFVDAQYMFGDSDSMNAGLSVTFVDSKGTPNYDIKELRLVPVLEHSTSHEWKNLDVLSGYKVPVSNGKASVATDADPALMVYNPGSVTLNENGVETSNGEYMPTDMFDIYYAETADESDASKFYHIGQIPLYPGENNLNEWYLSSTDDTSTTEDTGENFSEMNYFKAGDKLFYPNFEVNNGDGTYNIVGEQFAKVVAGDNSGEFKMEQLAGNELFGQLQNGIISMSLLADSWDAQDNWFNSGEKSSGTTLNTAMKLEEGMLFQFDVNSSTITQKVLVGVNYKGTQGVELYMMSHPDDYSMDAFAGASDISSDAIDTTNVTQIGSVSDKTVLFADNYVKIQLEFGTDGQVLFKEGSPSDENWYTEFTTAYTERSDGSVSIDHGTGDDIYRQLLVVSARGEDNTTKIVFAEEREENGQTVIFPTTPEHILCDIVAKGDDPKMCDDLGTAYNDYGDDYEPFKDNAIQTITSSEFETKTFTVTQDMGPGTYTDYFGKMTFKTGGEGDYTDPDNANYTFNWELLENDTILHVTRQDGKELYLYKKLEEFYDASGSLVENVIYSAYGTKNSDGTLSDFIYIFHFQEGTTDSTNDQTQDNNDGTDDGSGDTTFTEPYTNVAVANITASQFESEIVGTHSNITQDHGPGSDAAAQTVTIVFNDSDSSGSFSDSTGTINYTWEVVDATVDSIATAFVKVTSTDGGVMHFYKKYDAGLGSAVLIGYKVDDNNNEQYAFVLHPYE
jgi:hypothetical protein